MKYSSLSLLALILVHQVSSLQSSLAKPQGHVPIEIVVQWKTPTTKAKIKKELQSVVDVSKVETVLGRKNIYKITVDMYKSPVMTLSKVRNNPNIKYAEFNSIYRKTKKKE